MNCDSVYIEETGWTGTIRIKEHKWALKTGDWRSKLVHHELETDHLPNFEMTNVLASGVNQYESRVLLEGIYTKLQPIPLNEAMTFPTEYTIRYWCLMRSSWYHYYVNTEEGHV